MVFIETERLVLRGWKDDDRRVFAEMNACENVMRYFPACLNDEESNEIVSRFMAEIEAFGVGLFALELKETHEFIGFTGFHQFDFEAPFSPGWEIAWRISAQFWHNGYATEAAIACINYARKHNLFDRVYAFTAVPNIPSENVMKRIGMNHVGKFQHPALPDGHWLKEHLLYCIEL